MINVQYMFFNQPTKVQKIPSDTSLYQVKSDAGRSFAVDKSLQSVVVEDDNGNLFLKLAKDVEGHMVERISR